MGVAAYNTPKWDPSVAFISDCLTDVTAYLGRSLLQERAREICQLFHANVPMQPPTSWESSMLAADGFYDQHANLVDLRLFAPSSLRLCLSASQSISIAEWTCSYKVGV